MRTRSLAFRLLLVVAICAGFARCERQTPAAPTPPPEPTPVQAPSIVCPSDIARDADVTPLVVSYPAPVVTGGTDPVTSSCTINSGSPFPDGNSDVVCTASDAIARKAQCVFRVNVTLVRRLIGTKFLAFGDSLTEGEVASPRVSGIRVVDPLNNYPVVLQSLLQARYKAQTVTVINRGQSGENAACTTSSLGVTQCPSEDRLAAEIGSIQPDALLLMEGTNDANGHGSDPTSDYVGKVSQSLRSNIRRAKQRNVRVVYLATLPPEIPGIGRASNPEGILDLNAAIRDAAAREGAILVDIYGAIAPQSGLLIGDDGLHPTVAGYKVIAETFLKAIQDTFEQPLPTSTTSQRLPTLLRRR